MVIIWCSLRESESNRSRQRETGHRVDQYAVPVVRGEARAARGEVHDFQKHVVVGVRVRSVGSTVSVRHTHTAGSRCASYFLYGFISSRPAHTVESVRMCMCM